MTVEHTKYFDIDERLPGFNVAYDPADVLPPDTATIRMAFMAINSLRDTKVAQKLYGDHEQTGISAIDLGSGSGVIGTTLLAAAPNIDTLASVDLDPRTLRYARDNIERARALRIARGLGAVSCSFVNGDWSDGELWQQLPPADLIMCNPPYLTMGEQIRPGYEQTPAEHLFVEDEETLTQTYLEITTRVSAHMRVWDTAVVRLPKGVENDNLGSMKRWIPTIYDGVMAGADERGDEAYYLIRTHYFSRHPDRPLHALTIEKLPTDYPAINPSGDARVDYYIRKGKDLGVISTAPKREANQALLIADRF